jgi:methylglutaconyl-CoA hydratase
MSDLIEIRRPARSIGEIVLMRSDRRNALSIALLDQVLAAVESLEPNARVVLVRGDGPVFCSGMDLREAADAAIAERSAERLEETFRRVRESPMIFIAAVNGGAYAGGAGLMAACDIAIAAEDAKIGFPEARRGLVPALISRMLHPKIRDGDLRDLFLVGEPVDARRALEMGLVQRIVPPTELVSEARRIADSIVAGGPEAIRNTKRLLNVLSNREAASADLAELHLAARRSAEAREGLAAFLEKRKPDWTQEETSQ